MKEQLIEKNMRDIIVWMKYAQYRPELERRETYEEIIQRVEDFYTSVLPEAAWPLHAAFNYVREGKLLPSMRAMHFAGKGIAQNHARVYNCAATDIENWLDLQDTMYLLLSGCGVGVGVEEKTFLRQKESESAGQLYVYVVPDSIEGWAESFRVLMDCWDQGMIPQFNYDDIRPKGAEIKSINAVAPGPDGLRHAHEKIWKLIHDVDMIDSLLLLRIICHMASAVMSGGIRRSALIAICSPRDVDVINAKRAPWWFNDFPELQYANISVGWREPTGPSREVFTEFMQTALETSGEPGFYNFGDKEWLTNPCGEILLKPKQFCNLVEVNAMMLTPENQDEVMNAAALIGFVQSRLTDFKFLQPAWKKNTEDDRLVGVSLTGIAGMSADVNLTQASAVIKKALDDLNTAFGEGVKVPRWTTVKPAGHTSLLLNTSSGIHSYPAPFYLRRITVAKDSAMGKYLRHAMPELLLEHCLYSEQNYKLVVPLRAPEGAPTQGDPKDALTTLRRIEAINRSWIDHGLPHPTNNISATLTVPADEGDELLREMYKGTGTSHKGITVLPAMHSFDQPMWEPVNERTYQRYVDAWPMFLSMEMILEMRNNTSLGGELACSAGGCEIA